MKPAFSVVFLTTLIGMGQGLLFAMVATQYLFFYGVLPETGSDVFFTVGSLLALALLGAGLLASFFHLAHPERAWRAATRWRTSWLSKEVIVLPAVAGLVFIYGVLHLMGWDAALYTVESGRSFGLTMFVGSAAFVASLILFICTGMIYASVKFIKEWAHWLTVVNYALMGTASGFTLAAAYAAIMNSPLQGFYLGSALILTVSALVFRWAAVYRNCCMAPPSNLRSAIGQHHTNIRQLTQGFMGKSFNTDEFFHGAEPVFVDNIHWLFLPIAFIFPAILLGAAWVTEGNIAILAALLIQYAGLLLERWGFFAQGRHPQNVYYQHVA